MPRFVQGNAKRFGFQEASFQLVLHHWENDTTALRQNAAAIVAVRHGTPGKPSEWHHLRKHRGTPTFVADSVSTVKQVFPYPCICPWVLGRRQRPFAAGSRLLLRRCGLDTSVLMVSRILGMKFAIGWTGAAREGKQTIQKAFHTVSTLATTENSFGSMSSAISSVGSCLATASWCTLLCRSCCWKVRAYRYLPGTKSPEANDVFTLLVSKDMHMWQPSRWGLSPSSGRSLNHLNLPEYVRYAFSGLIAMAGKLQALATGCRWSGK